MRHPEIQRDGPTAFNCTDDDLWEKVGEPYFALLEIGPEAYLSAVLMLNPHILIQLSDIAADGMAYAEIGDPSMPAQAWDGIGQRPALALAAAIAKAHEAQSGAITERTTQ